jgi:hypothetical protein
MNGKTKEKRKKISNLRILRIRKKLKAKGIKAIQTRKTSTSMLKKRKTENLRNLGTKMSSATIKC